MKCLLYIRLNLLFFFRNKLRVGLTFIGMCIGLLIYTIGNTVIDTYIAEQYKYVDEYTDNTYLIQNVDRHKVDCIADKFEKNQIIEYSTFGNLYFDVNNKSLYKNIEIDSSLMYVGVDRGIEESGVIYDREYSFYCAKPIIIYGRDIEESDIENKKKVIIIEKSVSNLLFGKENGVGEKISINSFTDNIELEVIGIMSDLPTTLYNNVKINNKVCSRKTTFNNKINGYIPSSVLISIGENIEKVYCIKVNEKKSYDKIKKLENTYIYDTNSIFIECKEDKKMQLDASWDIVKKKLNIMLLVINIILTFIILIIYLFSIKERFYEIGVRRALGASKLDIFNQFMMEGIMVGILTAIITFVLSLFTCNILGAYLIRKAMLFTPMVISMKTLLCMFFFSVVLNMLYSFIPAIYAININPVNILRKY